jgi:hypothetical protein
MKIIPPPIMGKVVGFVVLRTVNQETTRHESTDPFEMQKLVDESAELEHQFWWKPGKQSCTGAEYSADGIPSLEYFTIIQRDDNGVKEDDPGAHFDGTTKIGEMRIKRFCSVCGKNPEWFVFYEVSANYRFECSNCTDAAINDESDSDLHDGHNEREF